MLNTSDEDVIYFRFHFDIMSVMMAMHKITPEELSELRELARQMSEVPLEDEQRFNHMDYTFHLRICQAGKNKIQKQIFKEWEQLIYANVQENNRQLITASENRAMSIVRHRLMLDAIASKDFGLTMNIYRDFLSDNREE